MGSRAETEEKYRAAVGACGDVKYIEMTLSDIARRFRLNPTALATQLRKHYPDVLERRQKERERLGVAGNVRLGMSDVCREQYAAAVEHLRTTDDSIRATADMFNLSYSGLREHLLRYHKEIVEKRAARREKAKADKTPGALTGNGRRHVPATKEKYREAVRLYRTTAMTQQEACDATGVTVAGLRHYIRQWDRLCGQKRYLKSAAAKYAAAIARLKEGCLSTAEAAKEFGLDAESLRKYLHEHEPALASSLGMTVLANGRSVLARSAGKYAEAIELYETTAEPLKSIALRLGLPYKSVSGYIRRNRPDAIEAHRRLS